MTTDTLAVEDVGTGLGEDASCTLRMVVLDKPVCDNPATWAVRLGCCGNVKVLCDEHRDPNVSIRHPQVFICSRCATRRPPVAATWPI